MPPVRNSKACVVLTREERAMTPPAMASATTRSDETSTRTPASLLSKVVVDMEEPTVSNNAALSHARPANRNKVLLRNGGSGKFGGAAQLLWSILFLQYANRVG